jgi:excinuclease ABC subunit A
VGGLNIADINRMSIREASAFFRRLKLKPYEKALSREVFRQISAKLKFMNDTGLGYLTLDRLTKTLSGGEAQRVQIATQLAASLTGVLYILDEPSIGLHPVDIDMLVRQFHTLKARANTVVIVEHDTSIIKASDHIVELGPGAGERGGRLVYSGPTAEFLKDAQTLTADYLAGRRLIHTPLWRRSGSARAIVLTGASGNNLKSISVKIPLKTLTCVTGVSGSGKSSLVVDTLYNILARQFGGRGKAERPLPYRSIEGTAHIKGVKLIDQGAIGRTPRSNPVTYIGGFDDIRRRFATLPASHSAGLRPGHFSFNIPGGRCEACKGEGVQRLEMYFLPDVYVKCDACNARRYKRQVLDVRYRGKNIFGCLEMTFEEAAIHFRGEENLQRRFSIIKEVGLGYLKLGQSATTLSGGEAQRLKIARELMEKNAGDMLYIFDEPTTGLHMDDIKRLLSVLGRLVDSSNTVLIIEHNLDCIKSADHVIDLGPGGGESGGRIVGCGTPEEIARIRKSRTGKYLKEALLRT